MDDEKSERDRLVSLIGDALKATGHTEIDVPGDDTARVNLVRSCGRRAARDHGWRVQTLAVDVGPRTTRVFVMVTEADPMHERLWDAKRQKALRGALRHL